MAYNILFIINPFSGIGKQKLIEKLITNAVKDNEFSYKIIYTEYSKHAIEISKNAIGIFDIVVAVGGDGTINEVARSLVNSNVILGIIPAGSGNGFTRHLKIPLKPEAAFDIISQMNIKSIDTGQINEHFFINLTGIGFDAQMGYKFEKLEKRGFRGNFKTVISSLKQLKSKKIAFKSDENFYEFYSFIFSVTNGSQYGFNAKISPNSDLSDGLLEVVSINKFPLVFLPLIAARIFTGKILQSKYCETLSCKKISIKNNKEIFAHVDGEPFIISSDIEIKVNENSLRILVP